MMIMMMTMMTRTPSGNAHQGTTNPGAGGAVGVVGAVVDEGALAVVDTGAVGVPVGEEGAAVTVTVPMACSGGK